MSTLEGWHPMSTAPRNGTEVLIQVETRAGIPGKCLVGHYMEGGHCIEGHPPIAEGWYFWNGAMFDHASKPLRWSPIQPTPTEGRYRHIKSGGLYDVICAATNEPDGRPMVVYRGVVTGVVWVRPLAEFYDPARFAKESA